MKQSRLTYPDPFATLVGLTANALSAPAGEAKPVAQPTHQALSLFDRLDVWLWRARQRDLERSLASATDVADLEHRLAHRVGVLGRYI